MNRYPRSIRYAISTYANNPKKKRNISESQRLNYHENNSFTNSASNNNCIPNENPYPSSTLIMQDEYEKYLNDKNKNNQINDYNNKTEARQLIEQTKKMMEEYSLNKIKKNNNNNNNPNNINMNNNNRSMTNFGSEFNFKKNNYNNLDDNNENRSVILDKDRLDQLAGTSNSIEQLTKKLILKNKEIKILERELKEKTNQLKNAQDKIASKNEEIKKMLETLDNERSNSLKVENAKLNKKIFNLEKSNNEMKKVSDKNVEDLKIKLNNLNQDLLSYQNRNKELENKNLILRNDNEKLREMLEEKNNLYLTLKEKNEIEKKNNEINNVEINNLKMNLSNIIVVLKTLFNKESQIYEKRDIFLRKLNNLKISQDQGMNLGPIGNSNNLSNNYNYNYENGERFINNEQNNFSYNDNI